MGADTRPDWRALCRDLAVDPDEVEVVFSRYDAYRRFNTGDTDAGISLDQWFRFYRMEKATDTEQTAGPVPSGCSIDSGAVNNACIHRPAEFLTVLKAYVAAADT